MGSADIAFQCWGPRDTEDVWGYLLDLTEDLMFYNEKCLGAAIVANRLLEFYLEGPRPENVNPDLDVLKELKEYLVSVDMVIIHTTPHLAAQSSLFGLLCDAPVQLVDATDMVTVGKYRDSWSVSSPRDKEPERFFNSMDSFQEHLWKWCSVLETRWIYHDWAWIWEKEARDNLRPELVWRGPRNTRAHCPDFRIRPKVAFSEVDFKDTDDDLKQVFPNKDHPFILESMAAMPRFRPIVMFRYCKKVSHTTCDTIKTGT